MDRSTINSFTVLFCAFCMALVSGCTQSTPPVQNAANGYGSPGAGSSFVFYNVKENKPRKIFEEDTITQVITDTGLTYRGKSGVVRITTTSKNSGQSVDSYYTFQDHDTYYSDDSYSVYQLLFNFRNAGVYGWYAVPVNRTNESYTRVFDTSYVIYYGYLWLYTGRTMSYKPEGIDGVGMQSGSINCLRYSLTDTTLNGMVQNSQNLPEQAIYNNSTVWYSPRLGIPAKTVTKNYNFNYDLHVLSDTTTVTNTLVRYSLK